MLIIRFFHYRGTPVIMTAPFITEQYEEKKKRFIIWNIAFHIADINFTSCGSPSMQGLIYLRCSVKMKCSEYTC